jgi:uncharacterized membrane protein
MANEVKAWNKILLAAMNIPGVKVDRDAFLEEQFSEYYNPEQVAAIVADGPIGMIPTSILDRIAADCISHHTTITTGTSFFAGLPGGLAMIGTIPADITQFYFHVFVIAQKLSYIYGYPDLCDEDGNFSEDAMHILTVFVGVMGGVAAAQKVLQELAEQIQRELLKHISKYALTHTVIFPLVMQTARILGIQVTKSSFSRSVAKVVPVLGGIVSGGLTYATYRMQAKRLTRSLRDSMLTAYEHNNHKTEKD